VLWESSRTVIVVTASVKEMSREAEVTLLQAYRISLPHDTTLRTSIEQHICIKFFVKLGKYATETLEMLCEACGEHSLSWTVVFELHSCLKAG
jgi:hypothetical protein